MSEKLLDQLTEGSLIERFLKNTDKLGTSKLSVPVLQTRIDLLQKYWDSFYKRHTLLSRSIDLLASEDYFKKDQFCMVEEIFVSTRAELIRRIDVLTATSKDVAESSQESKTQSVIQSSLPHLSLPKFSGKQLEWDSFKELFSVMVKDCPSLSPILKLQHLLSCVEGEAARRLRNFQVSGANFQVAWDTLVRRYDNKRLRLSAQINRLIAMPPASQKSVSEITRLLDVTEECIRAIKFLDRPVEHWDDWFVQILVYKLDPSTREDWEFSLETSQDFPTYEQLVTFLENRCRSLNAARNNDTQSNKFSSVKRPNVLMKSFTANHTTASSFKAKPAPGCSLCKGRHFISHCQTFLRMDVGKRREVVKEAHLCYNCLRQGHSSSGCSSPIRCSVCQDLHHSRLHFDRTSANSIKDSNDETKVQSASSSTASAPLEMSGYTATLGKVTLLATAIVFLESSAGSSVSVRALLDPAAEGSFVTESVVQALSLSKRPARVTISGVGGENTATAKSTVNMILRSMQDSKFTLNVSAVVLPKLTSLLPRQRIQHQLWDHLRDLNLADPNYFEPNNVDCILGADVYPVLLLDGLRKGSPQAPIAQRTTLGWILTGPTSTSDSNEMGTSTTALHAAFSTPISDELSRFWEIEEIPKKSFLSPEEESCERHFVQTHTRSNTGRYVVRLPFSRTPMFSGSRDLATVRLLNSEPRLRRNPVLASAYSSFIKEYELLGHMEPASCSDISEAASYYLPHHAVVKKGSDKLRVVFDASQKARNGISLNDCLHTGPKLQLDLTAVINRWRFLHTVFTADIIKMFRQIAIHPDDADFQRVLWRKAPQQEIMVYRLLTVTYGTACAPFLASRVLHQLAEDEGQQFPLGAEILRNHTYVDDAFAGGDSLEQAICARDELVRILLTASMKLDKWAANNPCLLPGILSISQSHRSFEHNDIVSTLGLRWDPKSDRFCFKVTLDSETAFLTKRMVLSQIARLYDPMGWLAPVIIKVKILIQLLWIRGSDWDTPIDEDLLTFWQVFRDELSQIERLRIPRWLGTFSFTSWVLHGFADASERAYAAVLYLVCRNSNNEKTSSLLVAKSKVSPIKTISVPRLELCAALLLARLVDNTASQLQLPPDAVFCWTDSQIVLHWLKGHPSQWHTFVANRVSSIISLIPQVKWGHVRSAENPADLATRGISPMELEDEPLWWEGPPWFKNDDYVPEDEICVHEAVPDQVEAYGAIFTSNEDGIEAIISRFSSFNRLLRAVAYMLRWRKIADATNQDKLGPQLHPDEIDHARCTVIRAVQWAHYSSEMSLLTNGKTVHASSSLRRLSPCLGDDSLLRVGGRLHYAHLSEDEKHPIIIPKGSHLAELLIRHAHLYTLHGGPQLVQSFLLRRYWIVHSRNQIRGLVRGCVRCTRFRREHQEQQMSPLPTVRSTPSRPFAATGLDYAGPFAIRTSKGRGHKSYKGYVSIFVCMVTRATHLEVVSDYTTQAFLSAFKRFTSRRGLCKVVFSDNGTNFQGADSELKRLFAATSGIGREIADAIAQDGVKWIFNPPRAPHFGGLWEAAVKSFKHHLRRVVGTATLTYEEFSTISAQIEACLNSRPLSPMSSDPEDFAALTPGHFLIGAALLAPPEPFVIDYNITPVKRWQLLTQMRNNFWGRWRKEVLHHLQQRSKWYEPHHDIRVGDLVLLIEDLQPPLKWPLARVQQLHPGSDGLTRVLTLRTASTILRRPLVKVIRLPVNEEASSYFTSLHRDIEINLPMAGGSSI